MSGISNEALLSMGMLIAGTALVLAVLSAIAFVLFKKKLNRQFDAEYGVYKKEKK